MIEEEFYFVSSFSLRAMKQYEVPRENVTWHVYEHVVDGVATKCITKTPWDGKLHCCRGEYMDSYGCRMLVLEEDDLEWEEW